RGVVERGVVERGVVERGVVERGVVERGVVERGARGEEEDGGIGVGDRSVRVWVQIAQHEIAEISPEQLL
ncbi:MAG: hypothetical protein JNL83_27945, partial [Myxococcales bacterium]|nr:hypothetical protein [Myxococcales bacterium]